MNQNEQYQQQYNDILDAVMKNALIIDADSYFGEIPSEEEIMRSHSFSPEFCQNMERLLEKNRQPPLKPLFDGSMPATAAALPKADRTETASSSGSPRSHGRRKLRWPVKAAAAAVFLFVIGIGLSDHGFLRASLTKNMIEYEGQGTLITKMREDDRELMFKLPSFIPDGYKIIYNHTTDYIKVVKYSNGSNILGITYSFLKTDADSFVDNERHLHNGESVLIRKRYEAFFFVSEQPGAFTTLSWQNGLVQYQVEGYESKENLVRIAESIMP